MFVAAIAMVVAVAAAASGVPEPHFVDGAHVPADAAAGESLASLQTHTCAELVTAHLPLRTRLAQQASERDEAAQLALGALQQRGAAACDWRAPALLFALHSDCGLGAELHWLTVALTAAIDTQRTLVLREVRISYLSDCLCDVIVADCEL